MERELAIFKEKLDNLLLFSLPDLVVIYQDWKIIFVNQAAVEIMGYSYEELTGSNILEFVDPKYHQAIRANVLRGFSGKEVEDYEIKIIAKTGERRTCIIRGKIVTMFGRPAGLMVLTDITQRKKAEEVIIYQKKLYEALFENTPDATVFFDRKQQVVSVNAQFTKIFGYEREEATGKPLNLLIDPDKKVDEYVAPKIIAGETVFLETTRYGKDGQEIAVMMRGFPLTIDGKILGGYIIYTDISKRKKAEIALRESEQKFRMIFNSTNDGIIICSFDGQILEVNQVVCQRCGYSREELLKMNIRQLRAPEFIEWQPEQMKKLLKEGYIIDESVYVTKQGETIPIEANTRIIEYEGNKAILSVVRDITDRKRVEEELKYLSFHDKLTGLYNWAFFEEELKRLNTDRQLPISLIIGDVNGLKLANDSFGHGAGDKVLVAMAKVLKKSCRNDDIICRWGGDEFAIILPKTDQEDARRVCRRIQENCAIAGEAPIILSISLGTATKTMPGGDIKQTLIEAEDGMYRSKAVEGKQASNLVIAAMQKSLGEKSSETKEHRMRLRGYALDLGESLGLSTNELKSLKLLTELHDIGKIAFPDNIIGKNGPLTPGEEELLKGHCETGYRIAKAVPKLANIAEEMLAHHESWDGQGYPSGLKGAEIPLSSRILAIAHRYDDLLNGKYGQKPATREEALSEIKKSAGREFDPELVTLFAKLLT
jgi:diguanylate cyclase (GGDEF)-like protein/PAS domain S-box-containing protein